MKKVLISLAVLLIAATSFAIESPDVKINGEVRMRGYYLENFYDFDSSSDYDNWSVFRIRSHIAATAAFEKNVTAYVKFANQTYGEGVSDAADNQSGKVFVDNAWIEVKKFLDAPINLKFGRQNLMYGGGFVLFDGQSQMASTSLYFDGVKLTWEVKDKMDVDFLYFKDQENRREDAIDDDITLMGVYVTAKLLSDTGKQELYVLHKEQQDQKGAVAPEKSIYLIGARISDKMKSGLDYAVEGAMETGKYDDRNNIDQEAYAFKADLGYTLKAKMDPRIFGGFTYLSGDEDPTDDTNKAWDSFYGGWPVYGDLLAWKYLTNIPYPPYGANVLGNAYPNYEVGSNIVGEVMYSNLIMGTLGVGFVPKEDISVSLSASYIEMNDTYAGVDDEFGWYYQMDTKYKYSDALGFGLYAAMIDPGDAFPDADNAYEVFWETSLRF
ncbi:MAG: alginate export family protein [Desulfobacterales bacterium]